MSESETSVKDSYYFSHDSNTRKDPKIGAVMAKYGWAGYGLYWGIIECLRDQKNYSYPSGLLYGLALAVGYSNDDPTQEYLNFQEFVKFLIEIGLLKDDGEYLFSQSLVNRMKSLQEYRQRLSASGRAGAQKRWASINSQANGVACEANSSKVKISKVKESNNKDIKPEAKPKRLTAHLPDDVFIQNLKANPAYKGIDLDSQIAKMDAWLLVHPGRVKTKRFIVNWLNKVDKAVDYAGNGSVVNRKSALERLEELRKHPDYGKKSVHGHPAGENNLRREANENISGGVG